MASTKWGAIATAEAPEGASDEQLPRGKHLVEISYAKYKPTSNGKDMWSVRFKALEGPFKGAGIWNNFVFSPESPAALFFFQRDMETLGLPQSFFLEEKPSDEEVAERLVGAVATITVGADKKDKSRDVVTKIESAGEVAPSTSVSATTPQASVPTPKVSAPAPANARPRTPFDN